MEPTLVITIIVLYFGVLLTVSYFTSRKADNQSFFLGNRKSLWYVVSFGMISASLSGVTFISVPGWVIDSKFSYMQIVLGYLLGYAVIAEVLIPLYYKLNLTSIYTYLQNRFGKSAYKTGASFFLLSRSIGASFRLFLVANVLQISLFNDLNISFEITVIVTILLIWLYTFRGGIKTIIWTDALQTLFMLLAAGLTVYFISKSLDMGFGDMVNEIESSNYSKIFFFGDWNHEFHFVKQLISGALISIVMTGLDQDMMQKNLSCRNIKEAKKNVYSLSFALVPVNLLFLSLGLLLVIFSRQNGISLPASGDDLYPLIATGNYLPPIVGILFILGLVAAAYSSADSALTALTTSFTVDILNADKLPEKRLKRVRIRVHIFISVLLGIIILIFNALSNRSVIAALFKAAGYTYGPLLGLFAFGLFTKYRVRDALVPVIAILAPVLSYIIDINSANWFAGYEFGFLILLVNGLITFVGLSIIRK
jgi:Na+/proline symporter